MLHQLAECPGRECDYRTVRTCCTRQVGEVVVLSSSLDLGDASP